MHPVTFFVRMFARLRDIDLARTAGSLSYTTLLAVVPLATVALAFVARFPIFEDWLATLEAFVLMHFLPVSAANVVHEHVMTAAEQAARLTGISLLLIAVTAGLALATVEREFNAIWGVSRGRSLTRRILAYAVGLTAGPVLLGASISLTTWLIAQSLAAVPIRKTFVDDILHALPFVFSAAALTLIYKFVPARRVRLGPALIAGVAAAAAFEAAKYGFALYLTRVRTYEMIYGALAALPVFLLWIYLCWLIVLVGAALSAALAEPGGRRSR